jgi:hypothetical protein
MYSLVMVVELTVTAPEEKFWKRKVGKNVLTSTKIARKRGSICEAGSGKPSPDSPEHEVLPLCGLYHQFSGQDLHVEASVEHIEDNAPSNLEFLLRVYRG